MISAEFMLTAFIVVVVPGTGVIYTVSTALSRGTRAAIVAAIGCTLGIVPHLLAAALGLSMILHLSALVFRVIRYVGVAYLLYMAYTMWRHTGALGFEIRSGDEGWGRLIGRAVLLNLLNPKLTLFFLAFLPQFLPASTELPIVGMTELSVVFMLMTLAVFIVYGLAAAGARRVLTSSAKTIRWIQRSFAAILAAFAVRLAVAQE